MGFWVRKIAKMCQLIWVLILSSWAFSCQPSDAEKYELPFYNEPTFTPQFVKNADSLNNYISHTIGDFNFVNEENESYSSESLTGKIHVANFIFTSCGSICPNMTKNMKLVSGAFPKDKDFEILSFSVTPWIDTPEKLKKYKFENNIPNQNWHFLTGKTAEIYKLARTSYFAEEDIGYTKDSADFLHTEHVLLVDKSRRIRGIYNGTLQLEMEQLIKDINTLKNEK